MAHGIAKQDLIFSTTGTEWHGKALVVPAIGQTEIDRVSFPILETTFGFSVDGIYIPMPEHKIVAADLRHRLELPENERIVPLNIPKTGYCAISNRDIYEQAVNICHGLSMKIVTMGTLEGCKKFFLSIDTGDSNLIVKNRATGIKENVLAYIDLINSHDGSLAQETYDSMTRIVCMNTLRWSREAKGSIGGKVYHTKNAKLAMDSMAKRINEVMKNRVEFVQRMEALSEVTISKADALNVTLAYLAKNNEEGKRDKISTRGMNAAESIVDLYDRGRGNVGKSLYDLFNGATDYWTNGDGTGKKADVGTKLFKSRHGTAADHKENFLSFIDRNDLTEEIETGKRIHTQFLSLAN